MTYLLIVSVIWAFSFGLIKDQLTGLDPNFVAFARMTLSFLLFIPFLRPSKVSWTAAARLVLTGMIQYGVMYSAYIYSFRYLPAHMVALFTIFTPIYITLINDLFEKKIHPHFHIVALMAVSGVGVMVYRNQDLGAFFTGFMLVQISNLAFAFGQVYYKRIMSNYPGVKDRQIFGFLFLGALLFTLPATVISMEGTLPDLLPVHIYTLLYLGILASGAGFFLWNYGVRRTDVGTLAVINNLKIPLAVTVSIIFFNEQGDIPRLLLGGGTLLLALYLNQKIVKKK